MFRKILLVSLSFTAVAGLAGCGGSLLEENWGRSYETALYQQTLDPKADRNLAPVEGLEGPSAIRILDQYRQGGQREIKTSSPGYGMLTIHE